jgi:soluble lytic murein transglycosylase-like protein
VSGEISSRATSEIGPPAPLSITRNIQGPEASRYTVLRRLAESSGTAAADTLKRFEPEIHSAARAAGLDPALLLAVVLEESGGDPDALSNKGALGLMQLMPGTADEVGVEDRSAPGENLRGGAEYLARMIRRHDGNLETALAAYNAGPGSVARAGGRIPDFPETRHYVRRVIDRYRELSGGTQMASGKR